jgi:hypothetical protein
VGATRAPPAESEEWVDEPAAGVPDAGGAQGVVVTAADLGYSDSADEPED